MKLLIVEDEMIIAMRLEQFVTDLGHQVCAMASTEDGAIASAEMHRPDIVLMDLRLARGKWRRGCMPDLHKLRHPFDRCQCEY